MRKPVLVGCAGGPEAAQPCTDIGIADRQRIEVTGFKVWTDRARKINGMPSAETAMHALTMSQCSDRDRSTGKLFAKAVEEANEGSIEVLTAAGASKFSTLLLGYWPQVRPAFWSTALFRWDINVRESAVPGLVGAGGIGVALDTALNLLYWGQVAVVLLDIFFVVIVAEIIVTTVRARILRGLIPFRLLFRPEFADGRKWEASFFST